MMAHHTKLTVAIKYINTTKIAVQSLNGSLHSIGESPVRLKGIDEKSILQ
jgi:hypothetical protein